jgi:HD superfamily phosphohydrolase YqeK
MSKKTTKEERIELFMQSPAAKALTPEGIDTLVEGGFFVAPASTKYHGAYEGGLFDHSYEVMKQLERLTICNGLSWQNERSPYVVGMFHDLCKIDSYKHPATAVIRDLVSEKTIYDPDAWEYNKNTPLKGHGDKSVMILSTLLTLTSEEVLCIRYHMGAFTDREEWSDYTNAIHIHENVLWTHHADMLASHVAGI